RRRELHTKSVWDHVKARSSDLGRVCCQSFRFISSSLAFGDHTDSHPGSMEPKTRSTSAVLLRAVCNIRQSPRGGIGSCQGRSGLAGCQVAGSAFPTQDLWGVRVEME